MHRLLLNTTQQEQHTGTNDISALSDVLAPMSHQETDNSYFDELQYNGHFTCDLGTDSDAYQNSVKSLNAQQRQILLQIAKHSQDTNVSTVKHVAKPPPLRLFVTGEAGSGKSFVMRIVCQAINKILGNNSVVIAAPTGVAAFNAGGLTLHRVLCLPVEHNRTASYRKLSDRSLSMLRGKWSSVKYLVIDEISMVSNKMLAYIHYRLQEIFNGTDKQYFGNCSIICFGDMYQLRPVMGKFIFENDDNLAINLWTELFLYVELNQNMRQQNDASFANLLNRFRTGDQTPDDYDILRTRVHIDIPKSLGSIIRLYPTIEQVRLHNAHCLAQFEHTITVTAVDEEILPSGLQRIASATLIPSDDRDCAGLPKKLEIALNCQVILTRNLDVDIGLVNGARGIVTKIDYLPGNTVPRAIHLQFHDSAVAKTLRNTNNLDSVNIQQISAKFYGKSNTILTRSQFPLQLCYAMSIHKAQGLSLDSAVVYLGKKLFQTSMAYVALSRMRTLDGVYILELHAKSVGFKISPKIKTEICRLKESCLFLQQ